MIHTVLAALDVSVRSGGVFDAACDVARAFGANLVLFRAVVVPPDFSPAGAAADDPLPKKLCDDARAALDAVARGATDLHPRLLVEVCADAWRAILQAGDEVDADLVVVGSHGWSGWDRLLGTNASRVVNLAERSVMVVHARDRSAKVVRSHWYESKGE